jgi:uncharacterized protein with FMN-binding domain
MRRIIYGLLATLTGLVLVASYRTSTGETVAVLDQVQPSPAPAASGGDGSSLAPGTGSGGGGATSQSSASNASTALTDGTWTGGAARTPYGDVQVAITVAGGKIVAVDVPVAPDGNARDAQISARALPELVAETVDAQGAGIDMISGATYTSGGYVQSLQSAIDEARA